MSYSVTFLVDLTHDGASLQNPDQVEQVAETKTILIPFGKNPAKFLVRKHGEQFVLRGQHAAYFKQFVEEERIFAIKVVEETVDEVVEPSGDPHLFSLEDDAWALFPIYLDGDFLTAGQYINKFGDKRKEYNNLAIAVGNSEIASLFEASDYYDDFEYGIRIDAYLGGPDKVNMFFKKSDYIAMNDVTYDDVDTFYLIDDGNIYKTETNRSYSILTSDVNPGGIAWNSGALLTIDKYNPRIYSFSPSDGSVIPLGEVDPFIVITLDGATINGCRGGCFISESFLYAVLSLSFAEVEGSENYLCKIDPQSGVIVQVFGKLDSSVRSIAGNTMTPGIFCTKNDGTLYNILSNGSEEPMFFESLTLTTAAIESKYSYDSATVTKDLESGKIYFIGKNDYTTDVYEYDQESQEATKIDLPPTAMTTSTTSNINDGGDDMYDGGNILSTNRDVAIPYTHTQTGDINNIPSDGVVADGTRWFGSGSSYFTNLYPGLFTLVAQNIDISSFEVSGYLGADGNGSVQIGSFSSMSYQCFYKKMWGAGDTSVNHLFIVPNIEASITHDYSTNTDIDIDRLRGLTGCDRFYYLLFGGAGGAEVSEQTFQDVANSFIGLMDSSESISDALTILNSVNSTITSLMPDVYIFNDSGNQIDVGGFQNGVDTAAFVDGNLLVKSGDTLYRLAADGSLFEEVVISNTYYTISSMAYHNGVLYAASHDIPAFFTIDPSSGVIEGDEDKSWPSLTLIGAEEGDQLYSIYGLASCNEKLYARGYISSGKYCLLEINTTDLTATYIKEGDLRGAAMVCGEAIDDVNIGYSITSSNIYEVAEGFGYNDGGATISLVNVSTMQFPITPTVENITIQYCDLTTAAFDADNVGNNTWVTVESFDVTNNSETPEPSPNVFYYFNFANPIEDTSGNVIYRMSYTGNDAWIYFTWND